jgi:hypothetical protein
MTTELPIGDLSAGTSEEIQKPSPKTIDHTELLPKDDASLPKTDHEKQPKELKHIQNSKFGKSNLKVQTVQLRGKPVRNDKSAGYRRKQP